MKKRVIAEDEVDSAISRRRVVQMTTRMATAIGNDAAGERFM